MPTPKETIEAFEMSQFGLDPTNPDDVAKWHETDPVDPNKPVDYSEDAFAFGGLRRTLDEPTPGLSAEI